MESRNERTGNMSMVEFKIQSDRIQSSTEASGDAKAWAWIAVKVSAGFDSPPATPTADDVSALVPWRWKPLISASPAGAAGPIWNPHEVESWVVWVIDAAGQVTPIDPSRIAVVSKDIDRNGLRTALDAAVDGISFDSNGKVRAARLSFGAANENTDLAGTVPGFIERLATLPDPLPRASHVHALLAIEPVNNNAEFDDARFIAAPRVRFGANSFDPAGLTPASVASVHGRALDAWQVDNAASRAQMVASIQKAKMKADPPNGRVIDLFEQTIEVDGGETAYLKTLPTADAVAELPQKLADAMDPLARIRSVLSRATAAWLTPSDSSAAQAALMTARKAALNADFEPVNGTPAPLRLKRALDLAAIQVLGQRVDLVGRFEVPLIDALTADGGKAARALLALHLKALPWLLDEDDVPALRIAEADITTRELDGKPLTLDDASPFSIAFLRSALGLAKLDGDAQPIAESDILRRLWTAIGPQTAAQPNRQQGLRYFEFGEQDPGNGELRLRLEWRAPPTTEKGGDQGGDDTPFKAVSFEHARASASLSYAAPFIEGIVAGRTNWYQAAAPANADVPLHERLQASMQALLWSEPATPGLYQSFLSFIPPLPGEDALPSLLEMILGMAAAEAAGIAARSAFRADPFDRITPLPVPMALQVDQLRTFPREIDAWTRLAGYGLVAARTGYTAENGDIKNTNASPYVSLNPATLYVGGISEKPDPNGNAAIARGIVVEGAAADDTTRAFVDPWPYSPGDGVGISDAVAEFANGWATAPMPGHAVVDQPGALQGVAAARIVAGPPPRASNVGGRPPRSQMDRLPAFSFGRRYEVVGHLVAQGGVLAPFLRHPTNPYVFAETLGPGNRTRAILKNYVRTTGFSAPTIAHDMPPMSVAIDLLANELPKRQPATRLSRSGLRINYDQDTGGTLVDWPEGQEPGLRFEFVATSSGVSATVIKVSVADEKGTFRSFDLPSEPSRVRDVDWERWWRIDLNAAGDVRACYQDIMQLAEEHLRADFESGWVDQPVSPSAGDKSPSGKEGAYLWITGSDRYVTLEPVRVVPLLNCLDPNSVTEVPGVSATRRAKTNSSHPVLLDGLDILQGGQARFSNHLLRSTVKATITGPGTDRHTWERWTNCALYSLPDGDPVRDAVYKKLVALQASPAPSDESDARQEVADPAVSALWVEVWETFPLRARVGKPICFRGAPLGRPEMTATIKAAATASVTAPGGNELKVSLQPGCVYELRVRAAIDANAKPFDNLRENRLRLGRAVVESCTLEVDDAMTEWLLGQASVLTVEVATAVLPEPVVVTPSILQPSKGTSGRAVDLVLPSIFGTGARRRLRYCKEAGLIPQRWSWRGTPRPLDNKDAFEDRADTDFGRIELGPIRAVHVFGAAGLPSTNPAKLPVISTRDLDWRGGWNLWRFKLRFSSRYAPLFAKDESSRVDMGSSSGWLSHDEKDADNARSVTRPPLALVVPLTEADDEAPGSVPPLLALFYGPMHVNDHYGDTVSAAVEIARHPAPDFTAAPDIAAGEPYPRNRLKFLSETGPDPIRTGEGHTGVSIPLKIEGAIGYSFDRDRNAGRFNNSGFLVTPATTSIPPWSMIKLKFRREEDPDGLDHVIAHSPGAPIAIAGVLDGASGGRVIRHEGIVLDFARLTAGGEIEVAIDEPQAQPNPDGTIPKGGQRVKLRATLSAQTLSVAAWVLKVGDLDEFHSDWSAPTGEPNAGWASFDIPRNGWSSLRLVVSAKPKPTEGAVWCPSGAISVQARINADANTREAWQSVLSLPVEALSKTIPISDEVRIVVKPSLVDALEVKPIRLSDFSASLWCQFTVPSSRFLVTDGAAQSRMEVSDLRLMAASNGQTWSDIELRDTKGKKLTLLSDTPETSVKVTDRARSAVTELMYAVLTEPTYDSLRRLSERPLAIVPLIEAAGRTICGMPIWPTPSDAKPPTRNDGLGRFRIMRVLIRKGMVLDHLDDLFAEALRSENEAEPTLPDDAKAIVLSISRPTHWTF
ncbi:hypothetical protein GR211_33305 [Rhizobium leguminosarum]|uniref:hypothetical protein n=1 Tax=Rhizobium ruizarguesonis TaxID=2081791 RepID=UPI0013BA50BD|nr:hypothetical protein [Rhizobium ruizarguesonis]NEJ17727.1 hypothetical protein [Rhizobium ruizarguesonis]NEK31705.1 hypothetical protein [Rhizobium ruizarguesonis]